MASTWQLNRIRLCVRNVHCRNHHHHRPHHSQNNLIFSTRRRSTLQLFPPSSSPSSPSSMLVPTTKNKHYERNHAFSISTSSTRNTIFGANINDGDLLTAENLPEQTQALLSVPTGQFTHQTMSLSIQLLDAWINHSKRIRSGESSSKISDNANDNITDILERIIQENKTGNPNAYFHHFLVQKMITHYIADSDHNMDIDNAKDKGTGASTNEQKNCIKRTHELIQLLKKNDIYEESTMPYNAIIGVLSKCQRLDCAKYSTHLLQEVLELNNRDLMSGNLPSVQKDNGGSDDGNPPTYHSHYHSLDGHENSLPKSTKANVTIADTLTFNFIISAWMKLAPQEGTIAGREAMRVLHRMKGSYRLGNTNVKPNMLSFSMTISALLKSLQSTDGMTNTDNNLALDNNDSPINYRQKKHQQQKKHDTQQRSSVAFHAEEVLQDMIYFYNSDQIGNEKTHDHDNTANVVKPDKPLFDGILNALLKLSRQEQNRSVREGYLKRAMGLLKQMEEIGEKPDTLTYNSIIAIILQTKSPWEATKHIKSIISRMKKDCSSGKNVHAKVKTATYNSLIKAYSSDSQSREAEQLLRKMILESDNGNSDVLPDTITWNSVIEAHAKSRDPKSVDNATKILHEMSSNEHVQPDRVTMSLMLIALSRSVIYHGNQDAGKQAVLILDRMEAQYEAGNELMKPDMFTYTQTIHCIAKAGGPNALTMALVVLRKMTDLHSKGRDDLKPDTVALNSVLAAMANSNTEGAARKAEQFLQKMEKSKDPTSMPNAKSYSTVISALAKSNDKDRLKKAEQLLQRMEKGGPNTAPNTVTYATILQVISRSNDPTAVERAMKILQRMEESYESNKSVRPNNYTYNHVMETIANSADRNAMVPMAQSLLNRMVKLATSIENNNASYTIVFNTAIKTIEKSSEKNKAKKAQSILKIMKTLDESDQLKAEPSVRTYNAIIRCCSFNSGTAKEKRAAFDIALDAFTELRESKSIHPDKYTYPMMFKACQLLLGTEDEDFDIAKIIFYFCCEDGYVDGLILTNLKNYLPEKVLKVILQTDILGEVKFSSLPKSWGRTIRKLKR